MKIFRRQEEEYPARAVLMCAIPEHGKSTLLQAFIANDCVVQSRKRLTPWPFLGSYTPPPVRVYDPKKEIGTISTENLKRMYAATKDDYYLSMAMAFQDKFGKKELHEFKEFEFFDTAEDAANATLNDMRGVLVIEELLTVPKAHYEAITRALAIRRTSTVGNGPTIYLTTQRPHIMPVAARAIPDEIWLGQITEPIDVDAMRPVIGSEKADRLPTLSQGKWVVHSQGKGERGGSWNR